MVSDRRGEVGRINNYILYSFRSSKSGAASGRHPNSGCRCTPTFHPHSILSGMTRRGVIVTLRFKSMGSAPVLNKDSYKIKTIPPSLDRLLCCIGSKRRGIPILAIIIPTSPATPPKRYLVPPPLPTMTIVHNSTHHYQHPHSRPMKIILCTRAGNKTAVADKAPPIP